MTRQPYKCRCGRETWRPELVRDLLLCPECAFDEQYPQHVIRPVQTPRGSVDDYVRPVFSVRRIA